jgi:hypothetical protein
MLLLGDMTLRARRVQARTNRVRNSDEFCCIFRLIDMRFGVI